MADSNLNTLSNRLNQKSANQTSNTFNKLAGGGKAASTFIKQKQKRVGDVKKVATQQQKAKATQQKEGLNKQSAQINQDAQQRQEELQQARRFMIQDVNTFIQQKKLERQRSLQALAKRRDEMRKQLEGFVDGDTLEREMEGINSLIEGGSSLIFSAIPNIQNRFTENSVAKLQKAEAQGNFGKKLLSDFSRFNPSPNTSFNQNKFADFLPDDEESLQSLARALSQKLGNRNSNPFQFNKFRSQ